jgi:hypothetical protein
MSDCHNITVRDLTVHGAYLTIGNANEQMHGVHINLGCEDIAVERVKVFQSAGDGLRLSGFNGSGVLSAARPIRRVWAQGCSFIQNRRTGVSFQHAVESVWLQNCYIEMRKPSGDACIDFEPSGALPPTDIVIESNFLVHANPAVAVSLSGISNGDPARRVKFINNTLLGGGGIGAVNAQDVTIAGNTVEVSEGAGIILFRGDCDHLRIQNNKFVSVASTAFGIRVAQRGQAPDHIWITGNHIETSGDGIQLEDVGSHVDVSNNSIFGAGAFVGVRVVLTANAVADTHRGYRIDRNTIANFTSAGIEVHTGPTTKIYDGLSIDGNEIYVSAVGLAAGDAGIRFARPGNGTDSWVHNAWVSGNRVSDNILAEIDRHPTVPFVTICGNPSARQVLEGDGSPATGSPEGTVAAPPGSMFVPAGSSPAALYFKQTGSGVAGWVKVTTEGA